MILYLTPVRANRKLMEEWKGKKLKGKEIKGERRKGKGRGIDEGKRCVNEGEGNQMKVKVKLWKKKVGKRKDGKGIRKRCKGKEGKGSR